MKFDRHHSKNSMPPISRFILFACLFSLAMISCKERDHVDGGPCSYKKKISPATIIAIEQIDSAHSEIRFAVIKSSGPDTVAYSHFFHEFATGQVIEKSDLHVGNALQFEEHEIVKGTCNPYFYRLKLEKYKE
jgi:hypothetical protein